MKYKSQNMEGISILAKGIMSVTELVFAFFFFHKCFSIRSCSHTQQAYCVGLGKPLGDEPLNKLPLLTSPIHKRGVLQ